MWFMSPQFLKKRFLIILPILHNGTVTQPSMISITTDEASTKADGEFTQVLRSSFHGYNRPLDRLNLVGTSG